MSAETISNEQIIQRVLQKIKEKDEIIAELMAQLQQKDEKLNHLDQEILRLQEHVGELERGAQVREDLIAKLNEVLD